jgi:hypothetical protein
MTINNIISMLHPLERKVLPILNKTTDFDKVIEQSNLKDIEVMRALQWLSNKNLLILETTKKTIINLGENGLKYKKEGFPEKKFLSYLSEDYKKIDQILKETELNKEELNACLGLLKRKSAIEIKQEDGLTIKLGPRGKDVLKEESLEEKFLNHEFPLELNNLKDVDLYALEELKKRKDFLKIDENKEGSRTL